MNLAVRCPYSSFDPFAIDGTVHTAAPPFWSSSRRGDFHDGKLIQIASTHQWWVESRVECAAETGADSWAKGARSLAQPCRPRPIGPVGYAQSMVELSVLIPSMSRAQAVTPEAIRFRKNKTPLSAEPGDTR